jgi:hypothetical protein
LKIHILEWRCFQLSMMFYFHMAGTSRNFLITIGKSKIRAKKLGRQSISSALCGCLFHFSCHCFDFRRCTRPLG